MGFVAAGITAAIAGIGEAFAGAGAFLAGSLGLEGATLGGIGAGSIIGGGLEGATIGGLGGGALNAIEGKPILPGVLGGALTGGAVGAFGPAIGGLTGFGATAGDVLAGAGAGALGGAVIPGSGGPLQGAIGGAGAGLVAGLSGAGSGTGGTSGTTAPVGGPGTSAAGIAAPSALGDSNPFGNITSDAAGGALTAPGGGTSYGPTSDFGGASGATAGTSLSSLTSSQPTDLFTGATTSAPASDTGSTPNYLPGGVTTASGPADLAAAAAGTYPLPPVPPSLDAGGNPLDGYPTLADATVAGQNNAVNVAGGIVPQATGAGAVTQALGGGPSSGTLGYQINPSAGTNPTAPAGAGPGGSYTLAQGATTGTAPATGGSSFQKFLDDPGFGTAANVIGSNPGLALGAGTVALDLLRGTQPVPGEKQTNAIADQLSTQATQLQSYLTSGTLPPGVSTALQQASTAATAAIRSQYAARGMSGSSAEAQDLANVHNTTVAQGAQIATQLLNTGINESNLAAGLYEHIMTNALTQDQQLSGALATLASAGIRPTISLNSAGTTSG